MTNDELQRLALRLANSYFVRYWIHWNRPTRSPWVMAIQALDAERRPIQVDSLVAWGFEWDEENRMHTIDRTNEDGTPFECNL